MNCRHRFRPPHEAADCFRSIPTQRGLVAILAGAGECGWGGHYPRGSRVFIEAFVAAWKGNLREAFMQACQAFVDHRVPQPEEDDVGPPFACATAILVERYRLTCAWVGNVRLAVLRVPCPGMANCSSCPVWMSKKRSRG